MSVALVGAYGAMVYGAVLIYTFTCVGARMFVVGFMLVSNSLTSWNITSIIIKPPAGLFPHYFCGFAIDVIFQLAAG